jgi:predicted metal-dependent peptidase
LIYYFLLEELFHPKLNWKAILYQYITKDILYNHTFARPGKRSYATGFYMPQEIKENLNITVTVDTSGSISIDEYVQFMSEVMGIANAFQQINMNILHWDTQVRYDTKVTRNNKQTILTMTPQGGGGTTMSCLGKYFEGRQNPVLMVHLTDGYTENDIKLPHSKHLFIVSKKGSVNTVEKYGLAIQIRDD